MLGVVLAWSFPGWLSEEHILDLTTMPTAEGMLVPPETGQVPPDERLGPGSHLIVSHHPTPESPFQMQVTVFGVNSSNLAARDPLFYDVRLTNTGQKPIEFPWSVDQSRFRSTAHNSRVVSIALKDDREAGPTGEVGLVILYGSTDVPESLETVQPGESVRISIRNDWMVFSVGPMRMRAIVYLSYNGISYPPAKSDNVLPIQALGKRR
jgi:hypothetical protein